MLISCNPGRTGRNQDCDETSSLNVRAKEYLLTLPDSAFILANTALNLTKKTCEKENADAHAIIGLIFYHHAFYQDALRHLQEAQHAIPRCGFNAATSLDR